MKRLLGPIISLGMAGICLIPTSVLAQVQKTAEPAKAQAPSDADTPFKPAPIVRPELDLDYFIDFCDRRYRPHFLAEYRLIRAVCSPTPEQLKAIARDGESAYQADILKAARKRHEASVAGKRIPFDRSSEQWLPGSIRSGLIGIAKGHLMPEQVKRLEAEHVERAAVHRKLSIEAVLDMIDHKMILGDSQRDEIRRALESAWQADWVPAPDDLLANDVWLPAVPDACVERSLTENQRKAWKKLVKGTPGTLPPGTMVLLDIKDNGALEDAATREAHEAATRTRRAARPKQPREVNK